ncbi:MAG: vitamin K epoxide reductase family protein [Acidimicrobiales bacterium]
MTAPAPWRTVGALVLSLCGVAVSTYLTIVHFDPSVPLVCSGTGLVNCARVTTSPQSYVFGIPVAVLGLAFYAAMIAMNLPVAWRAVDRRVHVLRLAMAVVGMGFVLYLVATELLVIRNICLWCTSVHVLTFLLFVLLVATVPSMLGWNTTDTRTR